MALWPVGTRTIALWTISLWTISLGTISLGTISLGTIPLGTSLLRPRAFRPIAAWAFGLRQRSLDATAHDDLGSGMIRLRSAKAPGGHGEIGINAASDQSHGEKQAQSVKNDNQEADTRYLGP
jgi:hypothetical protein